MGGLISVQRAVSVGITDESVGLRALQSAFIRIFWCTSPDGQSLLIRNFRMDLAPKLFQILEFVGGGQELFLAGNYSWQGGGGQKNSTGAKIFKTLSV